MSAIEPVVVVTPLATAFDRTILNDELSSGLPDWLYSDEVRITPRATRSAVLYTATGAHDLTTVIAEMTSGPAATTIHIAIADAASEPIDLGYLRRQVYEHAQSVWTEFLEGIEL